MAPRRSLWAAILLLLMGATVPPATARAEPRLAELQPYVLVQELRVAQDAIAREGQTALVPYRQLVEATGTKLLEAPAAVWQTERNASAAVIFVLSGGNHAAGDVILSRPEFDEAIRPLLKASLAYVTGHPKEALAILANVDIAAAPPTLRGNLALARAVLLSRDHPNDALRDFALARLYAPGGVVEEVALRLEIDLSRTGSAPLDLALLLRQLLTRFPHGLHLDEAMARVADAACGAKGGKTASKSAISDQLELVLPRLTPDLQFDLAIIMARKAALQALPDLASVWAVRAKVLALDGSVDRKRAELYSAAVAVLSNADGEATARLTKIDPSQLSTEDASFLRAVAAVDARIRAPIDPPPPLDPPARREPEELKASVITQPDLLTLVKRANASLDQSSRLLEANK